MLHPEIDSLDTVDQKVLERGDAVLYCSTSWCVPCRQVKPQYARASVIDSDRDYYIVDIEQVPEAAARYGIMTVPTILYLDAGDVHVLKSRTAAEIVAEVAAYRTD